MAGETPQKPNRLIFPLVAVIIIGAFFMGQLYNRVKTLEKQTETAGKQVAGEQQAAKPKYQTFNDALKDYAKQIGIDGNKLVTCADSGSKKTTVEADKKYGDSLGVTGTPAFFINGRFFGGAFPYESFKEVIDKELAGTATTNYKDYSELLQQAYEDPRGKGFDPVPKKIELGSAPVEGAGNAKITIVEFSDIQCPYCARAYETVKQVLGDYSGKVKLAFKHYPLPPDLHPKAQKAAEAVECAKDQGKFWEMYSKMMESQSEWSSL